MPDDMYGANQQESNENAHSESYTQPQEQPLQTELTPQNQPEQSQQAQTLPVEQPTKPMQEYSPAPEFGAYGPVNGTNETAENTNNSLPASQTHEINQQNANNAANNSATGNNTTPMPYAGSQNPFDNNNRLSNNFDNPYTTDANTQVYPITPVDEQSSAPQNSDQTSNAQNNANVTRTNGSSSPIFIAIASAAVSAVVCIVVIAFAVSQGLIALPQAGSLANVGSNTSGPGSAIVKGGQSPDWKGVAKQVSGTVVSIQTRMSKGMGKGSGAIIDTRGYVVTNNHVIAGAKQIQVTLSNGQMYSATLVGTDKTTDLAVLKLDNAPKNLKAAQFADSNTLAVGEPVMAIGNPLGYDDTATTGIVSALNRPVSVMDDQSRSEIVTNAVQIDAAINPGNSGGPTFNAAGKIIGINSSIAATSSRGGTAGSIGIGFAIPSNLVKRVVSEIIKNGSVKHAALGIMIKSVAVESNNITRGGAQIVSVNQGSPAAKAGLKAGDTIVAYNDKPVTNNYALLGYVRATALNEKATMTIVRGGSTLKITVTFDQEEAAVNGTNRQEQRSKKDQKQRNQRKRGNDANGGDNDDDDMQQRDNSDGDDGGIFDPFGFW